MAGCQIFADTTADLCPEMLAGLPPIRFIPMEVDIGGRRYLYGPGGDLTVEAFYALQRAGNFASTTQIAPETFEGWFEPVLAAGQDIIYFPFTSSLSGTYQSACLSVEELRQRYPERTILCVDSFCASVGHLFPVWAALTLNLIGIFIILTIPYCIGRAVGVNAVQKLVQKYPRFGELIGRQQENEFFLCFFLRVISCLPGDVVTLYMGATHTTFWKNLIGGTLGILPGMILATVMGNNIRDPDSPVFWGSIVLTVLLSVLSVGLEYLYRRKRWRKNGMQ